MKLYSDNQKLALEKILRCNELQKELHHLIQAGYNEKKYKISSASADELEKCIDGALHEYSTERTELLEAIRDGVKASQQKHMLLYRLDFPFGNANDDYNLSGADFSTYFRAGLETLGAYLSGNVE